MAETASATARPVRAAEVAAALCLATDLGMGFPWAHGLEATAATMRLCDVAGADEAVRRQAYFLSLLAYAGCAADATVKAEFFGGPITESIVDVIWGTRREQMGVVLRSLPDPGAPVPAAVGQTVARLPRAVAHEPREQLALCEVAQHLSRHLGLDGVADDLHHLTDRWDGSGVLGRGRGEEIPTALRIVLVARDAAHQASVGGSGYAADVIADRAGRAHDPWVAGMLVRHHHEILGEPHEQGATWDEVLAAEPGTPREIPAEQVDDAVATLGELADVVGPAWAGRSRAVAALAGDAAELAGLDPAEVRHVRRAALLQDVGRISVPARIWHAHRTLSAEDREHVRLHPYFTERVCAASPFLRDLARDAVCHHERLDGSGYHRGLPAAALGVPARLLAAADAMRSACETPPHGRGLSRAAAVYALGRDVREGRLDAEAVAAVVEAAGLEPPPLHRPAGLTEQESRVVGLVARGLATKQVARTLGISPKTADQHLQHAYRKIGVSSRAAVALFAAEHGLLAWGELLIPGRRTAP
ncbi:HD domain-containing phosphohydrolase [Isoptericola sediminis]|uniref:HD domain-containing protein n=1 Tax=Isoptericola sediminis TaxID=2733572 RepID=A0A849JV78_9MICO|nr:HD domain-containing phosphohydrolase [Isoptericola sediminis]NNU27212.1 HD domain-containing protein [Isoptericola sediminis]